MIKNERIMPSSDHLKTFVAIAEYGNLTHAAEKLNRTQAAISVQLRKLEETLNVMLFDRLSRGMSLTENGKKLLPCARRALAEISQIGTMFDVPLVGSLRVGIPDDFDNNILERVLTDFSRNNPNVEVIARSGCTSGFASDIQKGLLDIAVCSNLDASKGTPLKIEPTVWIASQSFKLNKDAPVPLAVLDRKCWWRDIPIKALEKQGRQWNIVFQSSSFPSLKAAIRAGLAVGILPKSNLETGMRVLSVSEGLPQLPSSHRSIIIGPEAPLDLTSAMANALSDACQG